MSLIMQTTKPSQLYLLLQVWSGVGEAGVSVVGGVAVVGASAEMGEKNKTKSKQRNKKQISSPPKLFWHSRQYFVLGHPLHILTA